MQLSICGSSAYASDRAVFPAAVNKNWLFPETGKEGFHYDDDSNVVTGLKKSYESLTDVSVKKFVSLVEKWFPDITEREQISG